MAGSNYSVNITLNTAKAEQKLKMLEKRVSTFRQNLAKPLRIETQTQKLQEKKLKNLDDQKASMIETRRIGDKLRDAESKGLKVDNNSDNLKAIVKEGSISDELGASLEKAISAFAKGFNS